ncbi:MAG: hypothetical protein GEU98_14790 [Pseudonocardiaceae bacterium]|nr:hypothetical protein [Pseudonocardiaceae bacterium]
MTDDSVGSIGETGTDAGEGRFRLRFGRKLRITFSKFVATSLLAMISSHLMVALLYWTHWTTAGVALTISYAAGVAVNYFGNRRWTWGRRGRAKFRTEVLPYLAVIGLYGAATVGVSKLLHMWVGPMVDGTAFRGIALNACVLVANALLLIPKFVGLDHVFGDRRLRRPATT